MPVMMLPQKHMGGRMLLALKCWGFAHCSPLVARVRALWVPGSSGTPMFPLAAQLSWEAKSRLAKGQWNRDRLTAPCSVKQVDN